MNSKSAVPKTVRLTKLRELTGAPRDRRSMAVAGVTSEGSPDHHVGVGYIVDGWFLQEPRVGSSMVLLRCCRNGVERLGLFTTSTVTGISETEIRTINSVYHVEHRSAEQTTRSEGRIP